MYCHNCGHQSQDDFQFCPQCGASLQAAPEPVSQEAPVYEEAEQPRVSINPAVHTFLSLLQDKLFFVICILMTVNCGAAILMGGLSVVDILITVFLWLVHAQAGKDIVDAGYLRCVSGSVYAHYVIVNVCAVIFAVCGLILGATFDLFAYDPAFTEGLQAGLIESGVGEMGVDIYAITEALTMLSGSFFMVIFLLAGALVLVGNIFTNRYLHRFAKSVYQSVQAGVLELKHVSASRVVLIIFAVICGLSALDAITGFDLLSLLCSGADCAACILAVLLMNKYLISKD